MFQSNKPKSTRGVRHGRKFHLHTDALRDTRGSRALNTQLPRVIAKRANNQGLVMDRQSFGQSQ